jgi:hypothetical protein
MGLGHASRRSVVCVGIVISKEGFVAKMIIALSRTTRTRNTLRTSPSLYAELCCSLSTVIAIRQAWWNLWSLALLNGTMPTQPWGTAKFCNQSRTKTISERLNTDLSGQG